LPCGKKTVVVAVAILRRKWKTRPNGGFEINQNRRFLFQKIGLWRVFIPQLHRGQKLD